MKKISVIVVSHNNKNILSKCLDALKKQSFKNFKIYLIDNDSTDGTGEFIKKNYPEVDFTDISEGVSKKRNIGISKSNSKYVITLDSDAILTKDWIKNAVKYMDNHEDVGICCGKLIGKNGLIDYAGGVMSKAGGIGDIGHGKKDKLEYNVFRRIPVMTTATAIIRRKTMQEIGKFDESFYYDYEDADFGLRVNFAGWKIIYNPDLVAIHLYHSTMSQLATKRSKYFQFLARRNKILTLLKNFEFKTLLLNSPLILLSAIYNSIKNPLISLKAYFWILLHLKRISKARKKVQEKRKISDKSLFDKIYFPNTVRSFEKQGKISSFFRSVNSNALRNITFFTTSRCNSRCKHCFYWKSLNKVKDLSLTEIENLFSKFYNVHAVSLGGGEPFLRKDIGDIVKLAVKYMDAKVIDIPTNCLVDITSTLEKILKENPHTKFAIHPSLDGLKEDHEYIRGVPGSFDKTVNLIQKLAKLRKKYPNFAVLTVNTVITNKNYSNMPKFINFVKTLPVTGHVFEIIRGDHQQILGPPSIDQIKKFSRLACKTKKHYNKQKSFLKRIFYNLKAKEVWKTQIKIMQNKKWPFKCTAGLTDFVIESDGTARICELQPKIGNLLQNTPEQLLESEEAKKIFNQIKNHKCDCTHNCNISSSMDHSFKNILIDRIF